MAGALVQQSAEWIPFDDAEQAEEVRRAEEVQEEEGGEHGGEGGVGVERDGGRCHAEEGGTAEDSEGKLCGRGAFRPVDHIVVHDDQRQPDEDGHEEGHNNQSAALVTLCFLTFQAPVCLSQCHLFCSRELRCQCHSWHDSPP